MQLWILYLPWICFCFDGDFMPWVNEALTWEAVLNMWVSFFKESHLISVWVAEHAHFQHYSLELVQLTVKNIWGDDEYIFSWKLNEYYIIRANSKENARFTFLPENNFQSLLPPVKMLTNEYSVNIHQVIWHILAHPSKVVSCSKKLSVYFQDILRSPVPISHL